MDQLLTFLEHLEAGKGFRALRLEAGEALAFGYCVLGLRLTMQQWRAEQRLAIPLKTFAEQPYSGAFVRAGLAKERAGRVYLFGAEKLPDGNGSDQDSQLNFSSSPDHQPQPPINIVFKNLFTNDSVSFNDSLSANSSAIATCRNQNLPKLAQLWNANAHSSMPKVQASNSSRNRKAAARWKESPSEVYWVNVIQRISRSSFCRGGNNRGWTASFDWLLQPETHLKASEGKYDDKSGPRPISFNPEDES